MKKYLEEYCTGCGLCTAFGKAECYTDKNGFWHPKIGDETWLSIVCPSGGKQQSLMDFNNIWGCSKGVYYGWSTDKQVRQLASSGGVITEITSWLLENCKVDGIIHTSADINDPTKTISCISTSKEELISRSGSRYSISHPLQSLAKIDTTKKYAFVGKPCDVVALKNYMSISSELNNVIIYTISFFCAGLPSELAQDKLLRYLECSRNDLKTLRYRGDGWPGYTTAVEKNGKSHKTDYNTSWGKILGRDIMKMCRFCLDGVGEVADISCGDAWYLTEEKKPDFSEAEGRNIIFARTDKGKELIKSIIADGKIYATDVSMDDLQYIQKYQWDRRATMIDKYAAMKLLGRSFPKYNLSNVFQYSKLVPVKSHLGIFKGIVKRVLTRKI